MWIMTYLRLPDQGYAVMMLPSSSLLIKVPSVLFWFFFFGSHFFHLFGIVPLPCSFTFILHVPIAKTMLDGLGYFSLSFIFM